MAVEEAARQKDELRDAAAALFVEVRDVRARVAVAEAHARRVERDVALLGERSTALTADGARATQNLAAAHDELVAERESSNERELLIDSLQVHVMELRLALARARRREPA